MRLVAKGNGDFDIVTDGLTIELSYEDRSGTWRFWNVNFAGCRVGGNSIVGPGELYDWLERFRSLALAQAAMRPSVVASGETQ